MTEPAWCASCGIHRVSDPGELCPPCADDQARERRAARREMEWE